MSVFIEILKCILCCEEDYPYDRDYSYRRPLLEPSFNNTSDRNSHVVNQSNSTTRTQYHYPNLPVTPSAPSSSRAELDSWLKANLPKYAPSQSSSKPSQSSSSSSFSPNVFSSSLKPPQSSSNLPQYSSTQSSSKPSQSSSSSSFSPNVFSSSSKPPQSSSNLPQYSSTQSSSKPSPVSPKVFLSSSKPAQSSSSPNVFSSSFKPTQSLSKAPPPSSPKQPPKFKEYLSPALSIGTNQRRQSSYLWVENDPLPLYAVPENIKALIKKDAVPAVLKQPLSQLTYKDYFAALLYAEDFFMEKWDNFHLEDKTLKLNKAAIYRKSNKSRYFNESNEKDEKIVVEFEIDSVPERRPFLLSRDFVHARLSGRTGDPFKGIIYRVVKSNLVLVEFGDDFHSQYQLTHKYDISFTFNRVCLKRAHQALEAASGPLFRNFLFPDCVSRRSVLPSPPLPSTFHKLNLDQSSAVRQILSFRGAPPYLIEGPDDCVFLGELSGTGKVVREAVFQIYQTSPKCHILICAPANRTCDVLMTDLMKVIPESHMFRANAAFREFVEVPEDILSLCPRSEECFTCPTLQKLQKFRVVVSTYISSFRLYKEGITAGHYSHIFLLDASLAIEPETILPLANLANEDTTVIVTGSPKKNPGWIRSEIGRRNGLKISYFERLHKGRPYQSLGPMFITKLPQFERQSNDTYSYLSFS